MASPQIPGPADLARRLAERPDKRIDVREPSETAAMRIHGALTR
jgi:rhodanese-related sulfurtransferase